jgi:ribosome maturation factor RimP
MILETTTDIWTLVEPYLAAERLELDDLEMKGAGKGRLLRVVVDGDDLSIDRLAELSRGISRLLDNETDLDDPYQLEISSPGLERKLRRPVHYAKSVGREVVVKIRESEGKRTLRGVISHAGDSTFTVEAESGEEVVGFEDVITAKTVFRWEKAPKPGH